MDNHRVMGESILYSVMGRLGSELIFGLSEAIRDGIDDLESRLQGQPRSENAQDLEAEQRQWHQQGDAPVMQARLRPGTRLLTGAAGCLLIALGGRRKTFSVKRIFGAGLLLSALLNRPAWQLLGLGAGRRAVDLHKTIEVAAPVDEVFDFWLNFQNFALFMQHVSEITVIDGTRSHWKVEGPAGLPVEWDAVLTVCIPNERLGWKTLPDQPIEHAGTVKFEEVGEGRTRVTVQMSYRPPAGLLGHAVAALFQADPQTALDRDLARLKNIIEARSNRSSVN